jgi:hypothetical protein
VLFGETGVSESNYWSEGHIEYPFEKWSHRYTIDPASGVVYQDPKYVDAINRAKDRWAHDDTWWLVEEALQSGPRYSLFRWRDDPTFAEDLIDQAPEAAARLRAALDAHPR